jgi:hypothetical protein
MKQLIVLFLSFLLIFPAATFADTPEPPAEAKVTGIEKGEAAPYSGVLLNSLAASRLFTEKNYSGLECDLKVKYELQKETARMQMLLDTTKASLDAVNQKYTSILQIKDEEIKRLSALASERPNDYTAWWAGAGIIVGIALTVAVAYALPRLNEN